MVLHHNNIKKQEEVINCYVETKISTIINNTYNFLLKLSSKIILKLQ